MNLKILVLYCLHPGSEVRKTIDDHLYCFRRYTPGVRYHYFNALYGIPRYLSLVPYDGVILHYTLLAMRWDRENFPQFMESIDDLKYIKAPKMALPQDEYAHTSDLWMMFNTFRVDTVFTLADELLSQVLYPRMKTGLRHRFTVLPGYVDELTLDKINKRQLKESPRPIDIGYRARKVPYWLGRHGQKKVEVGEAVKSYCLKHPSLRIDISTDGTGAFFGNEWIQFLLRCKAVLGCEGGSSLLDSTGSIRRCVERLQLQPAQATFEDAGRICFPHKDGTFSYFTISPRIFEAAMTRTCQILVEGTYSGILQPNVHYIPIKSDYSDVNDAISKFQDENFRNHIVEQAYRDLILSGKYTYREFAHTVVSHISKQSSRKRWHSNRGEVSFFFGSYVVYVRSHFLYLMIASWWRAAKHHLNHFFLLRPKRP